MLSRYFHDPLLLFCGGGVTLLELRSEKLFDIEGRFGLKSMERD
jgi:hypothetical protein